MKQNKPQNWSNYVPILQAELTADKQTFVFSSLAECNNSNF